ncbi:unnamed protein product [Acidithrix sp. C25]|nr:unnamed protein product [Acidithrix sp. C25]
MAISWNLDNGSKGKISPTLFKIFRFSTRGLTLTKETSADPFL